MKLVITGAGGMLARAVSSQSRQRGHQIILADRTQLDVTDAHAVRSFVEHEHPDAVIQCAAYTRVDDAERDEPAALAVNGNGTANVAQACNAVGAWLVYPSSDYVFDGRAVFPYQPGAAPAPINAYGRSKLAGEQAAQTAAKHLVVRTSWLYGAGGRNFVATILERARAGEPLRVVDDQRGSPTWTNDLAQALLSLLEHAAPSGIYHACNRGETTWYVFAKAALQLSGLAPEITATTSAELQRPALRPRYSVLDCTETEALIGPMRYWRIALADALVEGV